MRRSVFWTGRATPVSGQAGADRIAFAAYITWSAARRASSDRPPGSEFGDADGEVQPGPVGLGLGQAFPE